MAEKHTPECSSRKNGLAPSETGTLVNRENNQHPASKDSANQSPNKAKSGTEKHREHANTMKTNNDKLK
jgi:hypothetical protein